MDDLMVLGLIAAVLTSGAFFPQAYKVYRTKQHKDLALGTFLTLAVGIILWLVYGFLRADVVIIFANGATLVMVAYILWVKLTVPIPQAPREPLVPVPLRPDQRPDQRKVS